VLVMLALVVVIYVLIARINHGRHYAPQAYHHRKQEGAPLAHGVARLAPRHRRHIPAEDQEPGRGSSATRP